MLNVVAVHMASNHFALSCGLIGFYPAGEKLAFAMELSNLDTCYTVT